MKIDAMAHSGYRKAYVEPTRSKQPDARKTSDRTAPNADFVEISSKAYETGAEDEKLTATSGKDTLGITRGSKENSYVIHFSDSAMVSRAVARGYITVNGTDVVLTDDAKKQLTEIDRQAQIHREFAHQTYVMEHEMAVAKEQAESYEKVAKQMARAYAIIAKLSDGQKVSPAEERELLEFNPNLYTIAKNIATLKQQQGKQKAEGVRESALPPLEEDDAPSEGVTWADFDFKSYETQLAVSMSNPVQIEGVSEAEIHINSEK